MKKLLLIPVAIVLITLLVIVLILYSGNKNQNTPSKVTPTPIEEVIKQLKAKETDVTITATGFSPATVTIPVNSSVRWTNTTKTDVSVNSDDYPTNKKYPALNLGSFSASQSVILLFTKPGVYTYHNQYNPEQKGTITVQ